MYYRILAAGDTRLPDGSRFEGTHDTATLVENAGKYARHLGLIPFDLIIDERAAPPEFYDTEGERADPEAVQQRSLIVHDGIRASVPEMAAMLPIVGTTDAEIPQPFRICMIGEKTSLGAVLRPIAREVRAELLLETGEISESHAYGIAWRAARDGRPLRILYFADFDPSGWQISVSLARKLQAHIVREFPDLDMRLIRVALTFEQVQRFNLPDSPIKKGDNRAAAWLARWGRGQVEIDALAALRPDLLDQIAREAVSPYFDATLESRFNEATTPPDAEWLEHQPAYREAEQAITEVHAEAQKAIDALNTKVSEHTELVRKAIAEADDRPDPEPVEIEPNVRPETDEGVVFDSSDDFVTATLKLQRIKREYMAGDSEAEAGNDTDDPENDDTDALTDVAEGTIRPDSGRSFRRMARQGGAGKTPHAARRRSCVRWAGARFASAGCTAASCIRQSVTGAPAPQIGERIRLVKRAQKARGEFTGGPPPFGFRHDEWKNLVPIPEQQEAIQQMRQLKAKGYSLRSIAVRMREKGTKISHVGVQRVLAAVERWAA